MKSTQISSLRKTIGLTTGAFWMSGIWPRQTFYTNGLIKFAQWPWLWFKRTFWMPVFFPCSGKDGSCVVSTLYFDFIWYFSYIKVDQFIILLHLQCCIKDYLLTSWTFSYSWNTGKGNIKCLNSAGAVHPELFYSFEHTWTDDYCRNSPTVTRVVTISTKMSRPPGLDTSEQR